MTNQEQSQTGSTSKPLTSETIMKALDWAYDAAVSGGNMVDSAPEMGDSYLKGAGTLTDQVNSLIRWQNTKAATSGFVAGLGGIFTLPVTLPANITSVLFVQVRMIAAIAYMGGFDLKDDRVRTLVYTCLVGNNAAAVLKGVGIEAGKRFTTQAIKGISGKTLTSINQKVGFRLVTKFGEKGVVNLGKAVPLVGGAIGAALDGVWTNQIGNAARDAFISDSAKPNAAEPKG